MRHSIKVLLEQIKFTQLELDRAKYKYDSEDFEMNCEMEFVKNDIENLSHQLLDLQDAIKTLENLK